MRPYRDPYLLPRYKPLSAPDTNLIQQNQAGSGKTPKYTYDALDHDLTVVYRGDSMLSIVRVYDQPTAHGFGIGRLTSATDQVGSLGITYDERGNVTNEVRVVKGAGTLTTLTGYAAASNVASTA